MGLASGGSNGGAVALDDKCGGGAAAFADFTSGNASCDSACIFMARMTPATTE